MKKNVLIKIIFITFSFILIFSIVNNVEASSFNPGAYRPGKLTKGEAQSLFGMGEKLIGTLMNIATVVAILTMAIIGVKYIYGSAEQKAEYKATLVPWFVGAILVVMITSFLGIIEKAASII